MEQLQLVKYSPGCSKFNPSLIFIILFSFQNFFFTVERSFSHMTKQLGGLVLDPEEQVILDPRATDPRLKLNTDVVKSAINTVAESLQSYSYNGFHWTINQISPDKDANEVEIEGKLVPRTFQDQEDLYKFHRLNSLAKIQGIENKKLLAEYKFFNEHLDQRAHMMVFTR